MTIEEPSCSDPGGTGERPAGVAVVDCLLLVLTAQCNLNCAYCFQNARKSGRMDWETLRAGLGFALTEGASRTDIVFSGGEPLLEFDLICRAVEYVETISLSQGRLRYWLSTNGLLFSSQIADFLQRHRFRIQLSFDGLAPAQDHRGANTFGILDQLLDSLRGSYPDLFQRGLRISMMLTPATVGCMASSVEYFLRKGVSEIVIAPTLTSDPEWTTADTEQLDAQMARISDISLSHLERTGQVPLSALRRAGEKAARRSPRRPLCRGLSGRVLAVDVDGQVYRCPLFAESCQEFPAGSLIAGLKDFRTGDIKDPSFKERRAASLQAVRKMPVPDWENCRSSHGRCGDCQYYAECSVCPVAIWSKPNELSPHWVPDFVCAFKRTILKYSERFPCARSFLHGRVSWLEEADPLEPLRGSL